VTPANPEQEPVPLTPVQNPDPWGIKRVENLITALTGVLSALLDNAPTYLVFFELAGGDAGRLMGELGSTLAAISMGAVFMGALSYIGNAPNFMIYAIATERGIKMPSFFGYLLWSCAVLLPVFVLLTYVSVGRP